MATEKQELETNDRWKARYYEVLEELEGRQKEWQQAVQLLDGLATQLARATDKQAGDLSSVLSDLQRESASSEDAGELQSHINTISQRLVELYHHTGTGKAAHPANVFIDILEKLQLPEQLEPEFRLLKKNVKRLAWQDEGSEVSASFMNIIQRLLHDDEELIRPTRKQKLISRLLTRASQAEAAAESTDANKQAKAVKSEQEVQQRYIAPAVGELLLQLALRMPDDVKRKINFATLKRHTNKARRRKDLIPIIDVIAQQIESAYQSEQNVPVLLKNESVESIANAISPVFEQLATPVDLKPRIAEIEAKFIENKDDVDTLVYCLNALNEVVAEVSRRFANQRDELEQFLSQAVDQYHALDDELQNTGPRFDELAGNDKALAEVIRQEIADLKNSIENAEDLQDSRTQILERLDSLQQRASELYSSANERNDVAGKIFDSLKGGLNEMEGASADLRNKLDEFRQQSSDDVLTGIPNRYAYEKQLATELARCKRYGSTLSLVVWRMSQLKELVHTYGHAAGDKILQEVAGRLSERVRATDFVARYGTDVFVTLMTETKLDDAVNVAADVCEQLEKVPFMYHDTRVSLSMTAGVVQYQDEETANSLFERADQAVRKLIPD
jgi:diguanylate cyclase